MSVRRTASIAATAAAAVTVSAAIGTGPAMAETRTTHDARHDVVRLAADGPSTAGHVVHQRRSGDVISMRTTYGHARVRVTLRYATLAPVTSKKRQVVHIVTLRTDTGHRSNVSLVVSRNQSQGQRLFERDDSISRCRGLHTRVDYHRDRVRFSIPRACLSNPRWVRVGGGGGVLTDRWLYADDVSSKGTVQDDLVLGPRVHRG